MIDIHKFNWIFLKIDIPSNPNFKIITLKEICPFKSVKIGILDFHFVTKICIQYFQFQSKSFPYMLFEVN